MGARLLLLRHGQTRANQQGRWHGSTDGPLTWRGRRQAKRTGRYLAAAQNISAVYTSPLQRCMDTAAFATAHLDLQPVTLAGLEEMSLGEWEAMTFRLLAEEHNLIPRLSEDHNFSAPGGESLNQVANRVTAALQEIDRGHGEDETVLVVSHGVALAVGLAVCFQKDPGAWTDYRFHNCSLTELVLSPEPLLMGYNEHFHL